ncbi:mandelate racemase/muconate lactonizing enzyme family protein [Kallotenue papyrolyticum]|uniref:mandelate racemase/muconate lactonizing enzyme family protein n=1 Tax=Kallotenue papyrolyticum TaxID=1325125 RepID=UPI0004785C9E|nr:mandelate racemase/muconate lactonizing enzyme family protein [Kallotenue papyrolyticum]
MQITHVRTAVIEGNFDWTIVRIDTDRDIYGLGESFCAPGLTAIIRDLAPLLIGEDPRHVDRLWNKLRWAASGAGSQAGIVYNAISGIETALLDITGKYYNAPLWQLLGGKYRDRVRIYADCHAGEALESLSALMVARRPRWLPTDEAEALPCGLASELNRPAHGRAYGSPQLSDIFTPELYARRAREVVALGFTALKFDLDVPNPYTHDSFNGVLSHAEIRYMTRLVEAVREAVGDTIDIAFDCHWRYNVSDAIRLACALEPYGLAWLEDPVPPDNIEAMRRVREATRTPISSGENYYLRYGFREALERHALSIVAPDLQKCGGLLEARRIADLADTYYVAMAPHNISSPIGFVAAAHVCAAIPNALTLEFHALSVPFWDELVQGGAQPLIQNGYISVPDAPGLGIELNEAVARRYARDDEPFFA